MHVVSKMRRIFHTVSSMIAALRGEPDFTCGDCDRWTRCDLSSSETCTHRAEQIARGDWNERKRAKALLENAWSIGPLGRP
jgi:hypothetical protein